MHSNIRWFNLSAPRWTVRVLGHRVSVRLWNVFNRVSTEGHWWGVGVIQIGRRHLMYIDSAGVYVLWIGETP